MNYKFTDKETDKMNKLIINSMVVLSMIISVSGCGKKPEKISTTGRVNTIVEQEIVDKKTKVSSIQAQVISEIAEKSIEDKESSVLSTPQRFATIGTYFSSYALGKSDTIVASIYNQQGKLGSDIWVFKNGNIRVTQTNYFNRHPNFSATGESIYFASTKRKPSRDRYDQNSYIWKIPSHGGGGLTRIGTPTYRYDNPQASPNDSKILFSTEEFKGSEPFIWYMNKNGALPTQLKQGEYASWIDEETILFSAKDETTGLYTIWTTKTDGSSLTQIIADNSMDCIAAEMSPDGKFIAFVKQSPHKNFSKKMQSRDIFIFSTTDYLSQQMTTNISRDDMPHWSQKGNYLYFRSSRGVAWNIWRLSTKFLYPSTKTKPKSLPKIESVERKYNIDKPY